MTADQRGALRRLKKLNAGTGRMSLFLVHALTGGTGIYARLAAALPDDVPIFGIDAVGREDWGQPDGSIEAMARSAVEVMRLVQPTGPYQLCGYCLGGAVAHEMARQLTSEHDAAVRLLGIIDTIVWPTPPAAAEFQKWLLYSSTITGHSAFARATPTNWFWKLDEMARLDVIWRDAVESGRSILPQPIRSIDDLHRFFVYFDRMWQAAGRFLPAPAGIPFVYIETAEARRQGYGRLWQELTDGAGEIVSVAGTHMTVLMPPFVGAVAQCVATRLDRT